MSIEELSQRLDDRFGVLTGGSRTALPRHRTLRSLIDWSHDLLGDAEKAVLRRASVFAGGCTLEAAECVCSGDGVDRSEVLDLLTSLADKNLVVAETQGGPTRFGLLETVRHYAQDRLRESSEEEPVRDRHVEYFLDMAGRLLDQKQNDAELQAKLLRLDHEHDNVRAALAWCEAAPARSVKGLALAGQLHWFWRMRGHYGEGRGWIARLLAIAPDAEREDAHASAFHADGALAYLQGDYLAAEARHREALAIWRQLGNRRGVARSLNSLGSIAQSRGELSAARELYEDALSVAREIGDRRSVSMGLHCLGMVAHDAGDYAAAQTLLEECVSVSRDIGVWRAAVALSELGDVRHAQGDLEAARPLLLEALKGQRELGDRPGIAKTLVALATVSHDGGDVPAARSHLREALDIVPDRRRTFPPGLAGCFRRVVAGVRERCRRGTPVGLRAASARRHRLADVHAGAHAPRPPGGCRAQRLARRCRVRPRVDRGALLDPRSGGAVRAGPLRSHGPKPANRWEVRAGLPGDASPHGGWHAVPVDAAAQGDDHEHEPGSREESPRRTAPARRTSPETLRPSRARSRPSTWR